MQWTRYKLCWAWYLQSPSGCSWQDAAPNPPSWDLQEKGNPYLSCWGVSWMPPGAPLGHLVQGHHLFSLTKQIEFILELRAGWWESAEGFWWESREWRASLSQVWGLTRFPGLAWVWPTCGYCSLCDYHSEPGTTVPQRRTQSEFFRQIPLSQWKKNKDSQQPAFAIWKVHAIA